MTATIDLKTIDLKKLREGLGISQYRVAKRMSTSPSNVARIEKRGDMLVSTLFAYMSALHAEVLLRLTPTADGTADVSVSAQPKDGNDGDQG